MTTRAIGAAALLVLSTATSSAGERGPEPLQQRAQLDVAITGRSIVVDLRAPGAGIVGFEHEPRTPQQRDAMSAAAAALRDPLALFVLPSEADCRVVEQAIDLDAPVPTRAVAGGRDDGDDACCEIRARWRLDCRYVAAVTSIRFDILDRFPRTAALDVTLTAGAGPSVHEVTRGHPRLSFGD